MADEGTGKILFVELAPYIAVVAGVGIILYWLNKQFNIGGSLTQLSKQADTAATNYGMAQSVAATGPETEYNAARSAYAASIGWNIGTMGFPDNWPALADWQSGSGPDGFTYGSTNYPTVASPSLWDSFTQATGL